MIFPPLAFGRPAVYHKTMQAQTPLANPQAVLDIGTVEAVRRFKSLIAERYNPTGMLVFGSRARGTHQPDSDVDVAVFLDGEHQRYVTTKLAMADIAYDVLLETGIDISPLPIWRDQWEHPESHSNPALLRNIARDGIAF
jgi:predicted nucleotidyltransferase